MLELNCWSFTNYPGESVFPPLPSQANSWGVAQGRAPSDQQSNCQKINSLMSRFTHLIVKIRSESAHVIPKFTEECNPAWSCSCSFSVSGRMKIGFIPSHIGNFPTFFRPFALIAMSYSASPHVGQVGLRGIARRIRV